jgi:16S rRNA (guanine527-N7)-methyltransferase
MDYQLRPRPAVLSAAQALFGSRLPLAVRFAEVLATDGVERGLIGPREAPRLWERHLLNCAAVAELIPPGVCVIDVGSGAGLPGIVLAIARPDTTVVLVEPMARRTSFLAEVVARLGLDRVAIERARAEECVDGQGKPRLPPSAVVTARAVASLDRLAAWCLPLVQVGGRLLALKGDTAVEEMAAHREAIARLGGGEPMLTHCGDGILDKPTSVVAIVRERVVVQPRAVPPRPRGRGRSGRRA